MAIDVNLNNVATFQNDTSAVTTVNANSASIVTALQDAVSISGDMPNQMQSNIDMNSNRLINLPAPIAQTEPLRVVDAGTLTAGGTITVQPLPTGGTTNQVLTKNSSTNFDASWENVTLSGPVTASQMPALTGDVTTSIGTVATTISNGSVTNSKLSTAPAYTLKGNPTASSATVSDFTISSLTTKASPNSSDLVVISDTAAAGALKSASISSIATIGSVSSIGGSTGTITLGGGMSISGNVLTDSWTTGDVKLTLKNAADTGWLLFADQTIGSPSSGATVASTTVQALYTLLWNNIASPSSNVYATVTGGLGASASADFAANKPMLLLKTLGRSLALAGSGSGLTSRALGSNVGVESVNLTASQLPANIPYSLAGTPNNTGVIGTTSNSTWVNTGGAVSAPQGVATFNSVGITGTINGTGGTTATPVMQPTTFLNAMIKL